MGLRLTPNRLLILFFTLSKTATSKCYIQFTVLQFTLLSVLLFLSQTLTEHLQWKISLFQIWMFNPKWKSGSYVDKRYSKVQTTGSRAAPCFLAVNHSAGSRRKTEKQQFLKNSPWTSGLSIPLVDKQVLRLPQTEASAALGTGLSNLRLHRPPSDWSLTATATNQLQIFRKMGWVGTAF